MLAAVMPFSRRKDVSALVGPLTFCRPPLLPVPAVLLGLRTALFVRLRPLLIRSTSTLRRISCSSTSRRWRAVAALSTVAEMLTPLRLHSSQYHNVLVFTSSSSSKAQYG